MPFVAALNYRFVTQCMQGKAKEKTREEEEYRTETPDTAKEVWLVTTVPKLHRAKSRITLQYRTVPNCKLVCTQGISNAQRTGPINLTGPSKGLHGLAKCSLCWLRVLQMCCKHICDYW